MSSPKNRSLSENEGCWACQGPPKAMSFALEPPDYSNGMKKNTKHVLEHASFAEVHILRIGKNNLCRKAFEVRPINS